MLIEQQAQVNRKVYEAPVMVRLGSVLELTRNNVGSGEVRQGGNNGCNGNGGPVGCA